MPAFSRNRLGVAVGSTLNFRGRRASGGSTVESTWKGANFPFATGGISSPITSVGLNYTLLKFNSSSNLVVEKGGLFDFVIVGGGGITSRNSWNNQGYHRNDGAGGAGQALTYTAIEVPAGTYTVTIGGNTSQSRITTLTIPSQNSQTSLRAGGGGTGGNWHGTGGQTNGDLGIGSGGGGGVNGPNTQGGAGDPGVGASAGASSSGNSNSGGGGGSETNASGANGGNGLDFGTFLGVGTTRLGGGGSSGSNGFRSGGSGGGGGGGQSGTANTGGGAGSQRIDGAQNGGGYGANGGSGVIFVRFRR